MTAEQQDALARVHKYKLKPPTYDRECGTSEEWMYKLQTHTGLQNERDRLIRHAGRAATEEHDRQKAQAEKAITGQQGGQMRQAERATNTDRQPQVHKRKEHDGSN